MTQTNRTAADIEAELAALDTESAQVEASRPEAVIALRKAELEAERQQLQKTEAETAYTVACANYGEGVVKIKAAEAHAADLLSQREQALKEFRAANDDIPYLRARRDKARDHARACGISQQQLEAIRASFPGL